MGPNKLKKNLNLSLQIKMIRFKSWMISLGNSFLKNLALFLIGIYRTVGTQFFGGNCRFTPSCSEYAQEAFHKHSFLCAFKLTLKRLGKCHPFGSFGFDPVPERNCHARTTK